MLKKYFIGFLAIFFLHSCKKFVEIPLPVDQLTTEFVFTDDNTATKSITGIYSEMMNNSQQFSDGFTTLFAGMSADELYYYTPSFRDEFVTNQISPASHTYIESWFWNPAYRYIYGANKCIEGVNTSTTLSPDTKQMIIGEAKFIRGFCNFYLVNLFGDVPLVLSSDYSVNQSIPRTSAALVYSQIIEDLKDAESKLVTTYPTEERVRPNKFAATALLARVYLYLKDWTKAATEAGKVINSNTYSLNGDLDSVFLVNSNETIWQLKEVNPNRNTYEGYYILPASNYSTPTFLLTNSLLNAFEPNDQRKTSWATARVFSNQSLYYPAKYKVPTGSTLKEYYVVLRLAEQYLIRAESKAQLNDIQGSVGDINLIRNRAGLSNTVANTQAALLVAIEQERRTELFAEWGHRWFDLKRTGRANNILGMLKPSTWQATDTLWPIPQNQIRLNPTLTQNPGY